MMDEAITITYTQAALKLGYSSLRDKQREVIRKFIEGLRAGLLISSEVVLSWKEPVLLYVTTGI